MKIDSEAVLKLLSWAYDKAVEGGLPQTQSAVELAEEYMKKNTTPQEQANALIRAQRLKSAATGFLTGVGGIATLPIAVPASVASAIYIQLRMIAAIAHIGGQDVQDDRVKALSFVCLCGNAAKDVVKTSGVKLGAKLTEQMLAKLSGEVIAKVNVTVSVRLTAKLGQKGAAALSKAVPFVGGITGALVDGVSTSIVGNIARDTFVGKV